MNRARTVFLAGVALVLAAVAAYRNSLDAPFLFDDMPAILQNRTIRHLWPPSESLNPPVDGSGVSGRPLVNFSLAVNYALGRLDVRGYHVMNLALHVLATLALWGVLRRTLRIDIGEAPAGASLSRDISGRRAPPTVPEIVAGRGRRTPPTTEERRDQAIPPCNNASDAELLAWSVALLWTVHPLLTESVVCVVQRNEILGSLFYLLTVYCFARGVQVGRGSDPPASPSVASVVTRLASGVTAAATQPRDQSKRPVEDRSYFGWLALSFLACLAGVASKEIVATAPLLVFLYDRTFVAGTFRAAWRQRKKYYFALAATWLLLAWLVWHNRRRGGTVGFGLGVTPWDYLLTQCRALVIYLKLSLWPHPLVIDYGTATVQSLSEIWWQGLVVLALLAVAIWALRQKPRSGFLGASFFILLAPSSSFLPLVTQTIAEHRMYLPLAAVLGLVAMGAWRLIGRPTLGAALVAALALGVTTVKRNEAYLDEYGVWREAVAAQPANARVWSGLGIAYHHHGDYAGAWHCYAESLRQDPRSMLTRYNLGLTLYKLNRMAEAAAQYAEAMRLAPRFTPARAELGAALLKLGRTEEALPLIRQAIEEAPDIAETHNTFGMAMAALGDRAKAIQAYETALQLDPTLPSAHYNFALALAAEGRTKEALAHYADAVGFDPTLIEARLNLGILLAQSGRNDEALVQLRAAVRLHPEMAATHCNLGILLAELGRTPEAVREYREALRRQPDYVTAHYNLGNALVQLQQWPEAKRHFAEAARLAPDFGPARDMLERLESVP